MATTTRVLLLQRLSEMLDDWWSQVTTAAGSATTTVDTKLAQLSADDDFALDWWIRKVATDEARRVTGGYAQSSTTLTHAALPASVGSGNTYELHRINPTLKHNALLRASTAAFPYLYLPKTDETLIVDDLLSNTGYEEAISGGAHPSWTNQGAGLTVTAETSTVRHGSQSAKLVEGGTGAASIYQSPSINVSEMIGKTATFKRMAWASAASAARLAIDFGGADGVQYGDYHSGDSTWRRLSKSLTIPTDATQVKCICQVAVSKTVYYDDGGDCGLFISPKYKYTIPTSIVRGPFTVEQQSNVDDPNAPYYRIPDGAAPTRGRILRLTGMGYLSQPTTDAGTVEIGGPQVELFLAHAMRWMYVALAQAPSQQEQGRLDQLVAFWGREIDRMQALRTHTTPKPQGAEIPRDNWHVDRASGELVFDVARESVVS